MLYLRLVIWGPASNEFGAARHSRPAWRLVAHFLNSHGASRGPQATLGDETAPIHVTRAGQITATDSARISFGPLHYPGRSRTLKSMHLQCILRVLWRRYKRAIARLRYIDEYQLICAKSSLPSAVLKWLHRWLPGCQFGPLHGRPLAALVQTRPGCQRVSHHTPAIEQRPSGLSCSYQPSKSPVNSDSTGESSSTFRHVPVHGNQAHATKLPHRDRHAYATKLAQV